MKRALILAACVAAACGLAQSASAAVTVYTDQAAFAAASSTTSYTFDPSVDGVGPPSYTNGPVTFTASELEGFYDAYGPVPYISDENVNGSVSDLFTITATGTALGLNLGSYYEDLTFDYTSGGVSGSVDVPFRDDTTFLGFVSSSGPVSVVFTVPAGEELDVPSFLEGSAVGAVSAAPEPAEWALMLFGVLGAGAFLRRTKRGQVAAA